MADVQWVKISTKMFDMSRKIKQIELMPEGDTILVIWFKLIILAGNINDGGAIYITPEIPYTEDMLAVELRRPVATVKIALSVFRRFGMIQTDDAGVMYLASWEKYQNVEGMDRIKEQNRIRKQRQRDREKQLPSGNDDASRDGHVTVTQCHATDKEREKIEDKEKEYHSFNQSAFSTSDFEDSPQLSAENDRAKRRFFGGELGKGVVLLSDEQVDYLLDFLSAEEFDHYVTVVANKELQGHHYKRKTHYQAILDMATKDRKI